jgi:cytochrome c553
VNRARSIRSSALAALGATAIFAATLALSATATLGATAALAAVVGQSAPSLTSNVSRATSPYRDLRTIQPISGDAVAGAKKAAVCESCHGANGTSPAPMFPRLAGQRRTYLYYRLVSFKVAAPNDRYYSKSMMRAQVTTLSDADMRNLAAFFAAQTPTGPPVAAPAPSSDRGEILYLSGDPTRGVPPCQGCHGKGAAGPSAAAAQYAAYPTLRGQYSLYLTTRLKSFRDSLPNDTTNDFIMADVAHSLDDDSIQSIATWLNSLAPSHDGQ